MAASSCDRRRERSRGPTDRSGESGVTSVAWIGKRSSGFTRLTRAWRSGPPWSSVTVISALASGSLSPVYRNSPSIRYSDAETSKTAKGVCSLIIGRLRCRSDGPVRLDDSPLHRVRQRHAVPIHQEKEPSRSQMTIWTISAQEGTGGDWVAAELTAAADVPRLDREMLARSAHELNPDELKVEDIEEVEERFG